MINENFRQSIKWLYCHMMWSIFLSCNADENGTLNVGTFWHITDLHLDQNYSRTGDPYHLCHGDSAVDVKDNGLYGNFNCDSPEALINVTIKAMKDIEQDPDFIIWTGDNLPHTWDPDPDWKITFEALNNITDLLRNTFPSIQIFPVIGNHDTFPPNTILLEEYQNDLIYTSYLKQGGWEKILPNTTWLTFKSGGYYSYAVRPGLRIIGLNTILWYESNHEVVNMSDPDGQLQWLQDGLQNATTNGEKVYIIGHVPPGFYNRVAPGEISSSTYHPQFLKQYLKIIETYHEIIAGQMFGHLHVDMFQLFQFGKDIKVANKLGLACVCILHLHYPFVKKAENSRCRKMSVKVKGKSKQSSTVSSALLASSVTPWHSTSPKNANISLPVNPSVRLMQYQRSDGFLVDYKQYILNLTNANEMGKQGEVNFDFLYSFTKAYNVSNVSTKALNELYEKLKASPSVFQLFYKYLTAGKESVPCDSFCKHAQLCSIACTDESEYSACMHQETHKEIPSWTESTKFYDNSHKSMHSSHTAIYAIIGSASLVLLICVAVAVFRLRRKGYRGIQRYNRFPEF